VQSLIYTDIICAVRNNNNYCVMWFSIIIYRMIFVIFVMILSSVVYLLCICQILIILWQLKPSIFQEGDNFPRGRGRVILLFSREMYTGRDGAIIGAGGWPPPFSPPHFFKIMCFYCIDHSHLPMHWPLPPTLKFIAPPLNTWKI